MRISALNWGKKTGKVFLLRSVARSARFSPLEHSPCSGRQRLGSYIRIGAKQNRSEADFPETTVVDFERLGAHWRLFELDLDELDCTVSIVFNAALFGRRQHEIVIF